MIRKLSAILLLIAVICSAKAQTFTSLHANQSLDGFKVVAVYLNDVDKPMGARFVHEKTGFTLDILQIESVPQAFIWVNTFPISDRGEPHTQEHLLITKGNKGHDLRTREGMSLAGDNAFTAQLHTAYDFFTTSGPDVFYTIFDKYLDALLYPDYTNEEVKREVRNWGVSEAPDKTLSIQEKGSVYNEMSTSMNNPVYIIYDRMGRLLYGNAHPLSYNAGGLPANIRQLGPVQIAKYHHDNYYLGNMGAIVAAPRNMTLSAMLHKTNAILKSLDNPAQHTVHANLHLPAPQPAASGQIELIDVPAENASQPGSMILAYPASLSLGLTEYVEISNFMSVFAGDATTNLYKLFVDGKTHIPGFSAQSIWANADNNQGHPVSIDIEGVPTEDLSTEKAQLVRKSITAEFKKIASYKDHSPELLAFNKRYENSLASSIKAYNKFVNSPPEFGYRNTGDSWFDQLTLLKQEKGFTKSITFKPQIKEIERQLAGGTNIWRAAMLKWHLVTATPYVLVSKTNPALIARADSERKVRAEAEIGRLKKLYGLNGDQETIARYKAQYDSNTLVLEKLEQPHNIKFIDNPPLTLDDALDFRQSKIGASVPLVASVFNNMTSATTGIALNLRGVPQDKLVYLAMLPQLLTESGIIKDGKAIPYEQMIQLIQKQILSLDSYYNGNGVTKRFELVVKAAGGNESESLVSTEWINDVLLHPDWTTANLPRLRDLVEQQLTTIRKTMQQPEEYWVSDPDYAYQYQSNRLQLATQSFLTRSYNIFRLKWMLKDAGSKTDSTAISNYLLNLSTQAKNREQAKQLIAAMPKTGLEADAAGDLTQMLNDIPDTSLTADWQTLCLTIRHDLAQTPARTLAELNDVRKSILKVGNARVFMIGSEKTEQKLTQKMQTILEGFDNTPAARQNYDTTRLVDERVKARLHTSETPVFAGLINPDSPTGVFQNTARLISLADTSKQQLLQFLAANLYAGAGKESVYTKTTGAGLSYSTGVWADTFDGSFNYYAERTPELPQTLKFVIHEVKKAPVDRQCR